LNPSCQNGTFGVGSVGVGSDHAADRQIGVNVRIERHLGDPVHLLAAGVVKDPRGGVAAADVNRVVRADAHGRSDLIG
jgi:hypothetical protein